MLAGLNTGVNCLLFVIQSDPLLSLSPPPPLIHSWDNEWKAVVCEKKQTNKKKNHHYLSFLSWMRFGIPLPTLSERPPWQKCWVKADNYGNQTAVSQRPKHGKQPGLLPYNVGITPFLNLPLNVRGAINVSTRWRTGGSCLACKDTGDILDPKKT